MHPIEPQALDAARMIGERFVAWQGASGRPDPARCPFVTTDYGFSPVNGHCPPSMARALYLLADATGDARYLESANRYAIFSFAYLRDPIEPVNDRQRMKRLARVMAAASGSGPAADRARREDARRANHLQSRAWQYGAALYPALYDFKAHNPQEECFDGTMEGLYDWLQRHRTDRGHAYNIGYPPMFCQDAGVTDAAYTDDLRMAGAGLVGYFAMTGRTDARDAALLLADYYLRDHAEGTANGAFLGELGTWCIGPWPIPVSIEHFEDARVDRIGWGWSARGVVEFLTLLHAQLPPDHVRAPLMRERSLSSLRWQFGCQFPSGAVGMHGLDDEWMGMTAAAILAYDDMRSAGWIDERAAAELEPKASLAREWLLSTIDNAFLDAGGYRRVTGQTTPWPPENLVWLMAWTVEALLRPAPTAGSAQMAEQAVPS